jgi:two-component system cell cycle response regulator
VKTEFTREEADRYLHSMEEDYDTVRLVDPENRLVVDNDGHCLKKENCHMIWGRCDRCENCTSLRALQIHGQAFKIEILNDRTYWVGSRYICQSGLYRCRSF